jgi:two-component system NarL family sensor kinase
MRSVLLVFLCGSLNFAAAQSNRIIDSLEKKAVLQKDSILAITLNELTWQYRFINADKAISYGNKAIQLSQKLKFDKGLAQAYNDLGILFYDRQDFDSAIILYNKAFEIRKRNNDALGMAKLYNKIGVVYQKEGEYARAMEVQLNALKLFESQNDNIGISYSLNNIGILCQNMNLLDDAIKYQEQSIKIKEKINDRFGLSGSYVNVANIYLLKENFPKAKEYYQKAITITRGIGDKEYLSNALNNFSRFYIKTNEQANALPYAEESYEIRKSIGDTKGMVSCLINIGDIYISLSKFDSAEVVLTQAYSLGKGVASCKPEMINLFTTLGSLYEKKKIYDKALEMQKSYVALKDSVFSNAQTEKFAELQTKYETLKKEQQITVLNKDNVFKALEIKNQQLQIEKSLYALSENKLALSQADLLIANNELEIQNQDAIILHQKLDSIEKAKNIQNLKKQSQIQLLEINNRTLTLNRRNVLIWFLGSVLFLGGLLGYSYYHRKQLKQEAKMQAAVLKQQELATRAVIEAEEAERQRIAKDLHDGVGQMMSAAKMNLSAYEAEKPFRTEDEKQSFERIIQLVDESCKEVRAVSHNMMPNALLKNSLASAIREFINKLDQKKLKVHLFTAGLDERLDANVESVLYRVIQECVNNVLKHADADTLDISVVKEAGEITATVEDNGKGFETLGQESADGIGLKNIRTRIEYLKGSVDFDSTPGKGTLVALHVPL